MDTEFSRTKKWKCNLKLIALIFLEIWLNPRFREFPPTFIICQWFFFFWNFILSKAKKMFFKLKISHKLQTKWFNDCVIKALLSRIKWIYYWRYFFTWTLQLFKKYTNWKLFTKVIKRSKPSLAWLRLGEGELKSN